MYLDAKLEALAPFEGAVNGDPDAAACLAGFGPLPEEVLAALRAACASLGMPDPVVVDVAGLTGADACVLIEGLDPLVVVFADELAAALAGEGYRVRIPLDEPSFLFGRPCVAFTSFQADLAREKTKQRDWHLLKQLAK